MITHRHSTKTCRTCRNRFANTSKYGDPLGLTPPGNPRLPWGPIAAELVRINGGPVSDHRAEQLTGHYHGMIHRWRHIGVELHTADQIAATLGHHPADLWGDEYWTIGFRVCDVIGEPEEAAA